LQDQVLLYALTPHLRYGVTGCDPSRIVNNLILSLPGSLIRGYRL